jgi:hypothetical protein
MDSHTQAPVAAALRSSNDNKCWEELTLAEVLRETTRAYETFRSLIECHDVAPDDKVHYRARMHEALATIQQLWQLLAEERAPSS